MALHDALEAQGFLVDEAEEGDLALELLQRTPDTEILVTDVKMPGMDGLALATQAATTCPHLKIIIMSGHVDAHDAKIPANAIFMRKPFPLSAFAEWLWSSHHSSAPF